MNYSEKAIRSEYSQLTRLLIEKKLTVTAMESATSGQIASLITDTEGASAVMKGALVTYSNEAKIMMGVPAEIIDRYTVYSSETSSAMARACAEKFGADIGIGVTGTMGNTDPVNPENSVPGQVYFSLYFRNTVHSYFIEIEPQPSRLMYKLAAADSIYRELIKIIE
ncbi:MAG: CinA family protein [Oscillospiraceae bacterium]|nr:CinA family protein [Oscillospiraceae bacterium]